MELICPVLSYPFCQLCVHHEVVNVLFCPSQLKFSWHHCYQKGSATRALWFWSSRNINKCLLKKNERPFDPSKHCKQAQLKSDLLLLPIIDVWKIMVHSLSKCRKYLANTYRFPFSEHLQLAGCTSDMVATV